MYSQSEIEQIIQSTISSVSGNIVVRLDDSLIDKDSPIIPADFLYIFDILEKKLKVPACTIFERNSCNVMTLSNLTTALYELQKRRE